MYIKLFISALLSICLSACEMQSIEAYDEAQIREDFHIPQSAKLVHISNRGNTSGGLIGGREGLRITATFLVNPSALAQTSTYLMSNGWVSSPLPDIVSQFNEPPTEIAKVKDSLSFCTVWYYGESPGPGKSGISRTVPCEKAILNVSPYKDNFDHYRIGVFDSQSGKFSIVAKNYY